jgi:hypothetical protein
MLQGGRHLPARSHRFITSAVGLHESVMSPRVKFGFLGRSSSHLTLPCSASGSSSSLFSPPPRPGWAPPGPCGSRSVRQGYPATIPGRRIRWPRSIIPRTSSASSNCHTSISPLASARTAPSQRSCVPQPKFACPPASIGCSCVPGAPRASWSTVGMCSPRPSTSLASSPSATPGSYP